MVVGKLNYYISFWGQRPIFRDKLAVCFKDNATDNMLHIGLVLILN